MPTKDELDWPQVETKFKVETVLIPADTYWQDRMIVVKDFSYGRVYEPQSLFAD